MKGLFQVALHCLLLIPCLRACASVSVCSTDTPKWHELNFPYEWWVQTLSQDYMRSVDTWSWSSADLAWLSLIIQNLSSANSVFKLKSQWKDDQHLIAFVNTSYKLFGWKPKLPGQSRNSPFCDIRHPQLKSHLEEHTPPDCLNFAVANSLKKGDRCKTAEKMTIKNCCANSVVDVHASGDGSIVDLPGYISGPLEMQK